MALIKCPNCEKTVSDKAEKCPHCGNSVKNENDKLIVVSIVCEECNTFIPNEASICPNCGCPISIIQSAKDITSKDELTSVALAKKRKSKVGLIITLVVCFLVIGTLISYFFILPMINYNYAQSLLDSGDYSNAIIEFEKINNFNNSDEKILECYYLCGKSEYSNGNLLLALDNYKKAKNFEDAQELVEKIEDEILHNDLVKKMRSGYNICKTSRVSISSDGTSITVDSKNKYDTDNIASIYFLVTYLNMPSSIVDSMAQTNSLMGRQSATSGKLKVEWSYHPDNGLDAIFSIV